MAAAHVTGVAALLLSIAPHLDVNTLRDLMVQHGKVVDGMQQIDAADAVAALRGHDPVR
jgi:hypothetical protein